MELTECGTRRKQGIFVKGNKISVLTQKIFLQMSDGCNALVWIVYFTASEVYRRQIHAPAYEGLPVG